jgi:signal transduction histidine kinase/CheY-like chemotaxis protein
MIGYSLEESKTINVSQTFAHADELERIRNILREHGKIRDFEVEVKRRDGTSFRALANIDRVDMGGQTVNLITIRDVTEYRRLEQHFLQSQKMETIGRLAGGVAHDFNNILTVINISAESAQLFMDPSDPSYESFLEIRKAGERAAALTRQLLAFSRRQIIEPKIVNINDILMNMDKMLRRLIGENIEFVIMPDERLKSVRMDTGQIEQVFTNLVVNARDAMPEGGKLTIETGNSALDEEFEKNHPETLPGEYVMFTVSDTGVGMDEETLSHIFEPFFTTKAKGSGTGLGLSTCYGIVRQNNGSIWVSSEPGKGTTVSVYLPAYVAAESENREHRETPIAGGTETILLVEDDANIRNQISRILSSSGHTVLTASNGDEALAVVRKSPHIIHLLVTDVIMPLMGGRELANYLTALYPGIRILFMSGYTDDSIVHNGVLEPGVQFIQKPFSIGEFMKKVRETLDIL